MVKKVIIESIWIKTRGDSPEDRIQETSRCRAFGCLLAVEQYKEGPITSSGDMDNMHGVLPTGKTHLNLGVENFYWC